MQNLVSNVVPEKYVREAQLRALKLFSDTIEKTYGPMGGLTVFSKHSGDNKTMAISKYTKDGATVLKNIQVDKPIEAIIKDEIIDITTQVIKDVGDGTSSATILTYLIFKGLYDLYINKGYLKRALLDRLDIAIDRIIEDIKKNKKECTLDSIYQIALTSLNGNKEVAKMIKNIYDEYGMGVFIDVQGSNTPETIVKGYDGLIYDSGFIDPCFINNDFDHTCTLNNPHIYIFESPIDTPEMLNIVNLIFQKEISEPLATYQELSNSKNPYKNAKLKKDINNIYPHPTLIICPHFSRDANGYLDRLANYFTQIPVNQRPHFCIVANTSPNPEYLVDLMKMTNAKFIKKYIDPEQYKKDQDEGLAPTENNIKTFAGSAEKAVIDAISMKIVNPFNMRDEKGVLTEYYRNYIEELKDTLSKYEELKEELVKIGHLKRRIHILQGNLVDLYVGGIGNNDRAALTYNIEDAVLNCRSAAANGIGYGANYEGYNVLRNIISEMNKKESNKKDIINIDIEYDIYNLLFDSYKKLISKIYFPYFENQDKVDFIIRDENEIPYNIITNERDGSIKTSINTEPSILDSIRRMIKILFNTNQFLVPDPRFNIYTMDDENATDDTVFVDDVK